MSAISMWSFDDLPFGELCVGEVYSTRYELSAGMVQRYLSLLEEAGHHVGPTAVVPAAIYCTFLPMFRAMGGRMEQGSIHTHQSVTVHGPPARVGDVLDVDIAVTRTSVDGDRRRVEVAASFSHDGRFVCTTRSKYLWGYSRPLGGGL